MIYYKSYHPYYIKIKTSHNLTQNLEGHNKKYQQNTNLKLISHEINE